MTSIHSGDILSYTEMCIEERSSLQRGMNYRLRGGMSVILMSRRANAPYADRIEEDGKVLIYEGHNAPLNVEFRPDEVDQPTRNHSGSLTQNGLFHQAVTHYKDDESEPELVKVYEKVKVGIWVYNGVFKLVDAWQENSNGRKVWKFRLEIIAEEDTEIGHQRVYEHARLIPSDIKQQVWKRDKGRCVMCGSQENLHFDHVIPYARGGSSLTAENIQILCMQDNLKKSDKIQ